MNNEIHTRAIRRLMDGRGWSKVTAMAYVAGLSEQDQQALADLPAAAGQLDAFLNLVADRKQGTPPDAVRLKGKRVGTKTRVSTDEGTLQPDPPTQE